MTVEWSSAKLAAYRNPDAAIKYLEAHDKFDIAEIEESHARHLDEIIKSLAPTSGPSVSAVAARERARFHREKAIALIAEADRLESQS